MSVVVLFLLRKASWVICVLSGSSQGRSLREGSIHCCWEEAPLSIPGEQLVCAGSHTGSLGEKEMEERL